MIVNRYQSKLKKIKEFLLKICNRMFRYSEVKYTIRFRKMLKTMRDSNSTVVDNAWMGSLDNIQIETINKCNGKCPFCPVNKYVDTRKLTKMSEQLFDKIINELSLMNYAKKVALFSNNEPLLDNRLITFAQRAREKLPSAFIYIYTNGTLLNLDNCMKLAQYLDMILIDCYDDNLALPDNILKIEEECAKNPQLNRVVQIHLRKVNEVLSSRGGQAPNKVQKQIRKIPCFMPFQQMIIRPDGKVSLCCNDALGKVTLGDLNMQTVQEVWNSKTYSEIREKTAEHPETVELCKHCDSLLRV